MKVVFLIFVAVIIAFSFGYESDARLMPLILGLVTFILILLEIINDIRPFAFVKKLDMDFIENYVTQTESAKIEAMVSIKSILGLVTWIVGFFLVILLFGFHIGIVGFALAFFKFRGKTSWAKALLATGVIWAFVFVIFEIAMGFDLYKGLIGIY